MSFNVAISSEEERHINDILDNAITEIGCTAAHTNVGNDILTSSITKIDGNQSNHTSSNNEVRQPQPDSNRGLGLEMSSNSNVTSTKPGGSTASALRDFLSEMKLMNSSYNMNKNIITHNQSIAKENEKDTLKIHEMNFSEMKNEMESLQNKISGLERKLLTHSNDSTTENEPKNTRSRSLNHAFNATCFNKSNRVLYTSNDDILNIGSPKADITEKVLARSISNHRYHSNNNSASMKNIKSKALNRKNYTKNNLNLENTISISTSLNFDKSNLDWKEKYMKVKSSYNDMKILLIKERQKVIELKKKNKTFSSKESQYDEQLNCNKALLAQQQTILSQLEESEMIRKEQARLIKSLQREVDVMREDFYSKNGMTNETVNSSSREDYDEKKKNTKGIKKNKSKPKEKTKTKKLK